MDFGSALAGQFMVSLMAGKSTKPNQPADMSGEEDAAAGAIEEEASGIEDPQTGLRPRPAGIPMLDLSALRNDDDNDKNQRDDTAIAASNSGGPGAQVPTRQSRPVNVNRLRSLSRRSLRKAFFAQPQETRTEADVAALDEMFYSAYACRHLTRSARHQLARIAQLEQYDAGETLCVPNERMNCVYFVIGGQMEYRPQSEHESPQIFEAGSSLGSFEHVPQNASPQGTGTQLPTWAGTPKELLTPRTRMWPNTNVTPLKWGGTVVALTEAEVALITQEQWKQLVEDEPRWDARQIASFLEDLPIFGQLTRIQLLEMARVVRVRSVMAGSVVFRQGIEGDEAFVVRRGYVRLLRELQVQQQTRDSINSLTHAMANLRVQLEMLTTPRGATVQLILPALPPKTTNPKLGAVHVSGAMTHRPRLEHTPSTDQDSPTTPSSPFANGQMPSVFSSPRRAAPLGRHPQWAAPGEGDDDTVASPRHTTSSISPRKPNIHPLSISTTPKSPRSHQKRGAGKRQEHTPKGGADESDDQADSRALSRQASSLNARQSGGGKEATTAAAKEPTCATPRRAHINHDAIDRDQRTHLRDVGRASAHVLKRALSRHTLIAPAGPTIELPSPSPLSPGLARNFSGARAEGATDRLLETLKSKKRGDFKLPEDTQSQSSGAPGSPGTANRSAFVNKPSVPPSAASRASIPQVTMTTALGPGAHTAFASSSPRHLTSQEQTVFVEMGTLASGRIFGGSNRSDTNKQRVFSAVADTNVELLVLDKAEMEARLGDLIKFLWNQEPVEGKPLVSDAAIRGELERNMKWEVYKKQLLQDVFVQKRSRWEMR